MDQVYQAKGKLEWLSPRDAEHAIESILEIQTTYDLDVIKVRILELADTRFLDNSSFLIRLAHTQKKNVNY